MSSDFNRLFESHDRKVNNAAKGFAVAWAIGALLSLSVVGIVIWAVIKVVLHFTS